MKDKNLEKELNNLRTNEKLNTQFNEDLWSDLSEKYNKFNYLNSVMKDTNKKERLPFFKKRNLLVGILSIVAFFTIVAVPTYSYLKVPTFQETVNRLLKIVPIGTVEINSTPDGAQAFINGEYQGLTPLTLELPEGNYTLFLNKDDVGMKYETFEVKASEVTTLAVDLSQEDAVVDEYADWSVYSNDRLGSGVAFRYPRNWDIKEIEAPGAFVIAVSNDDFTVKVIHSLFSQASDLVAQPEEFTKEINNANLIDSAKKELRLATVEDNYTVVERIDVEFSINDLSGEDIAMGLSDGSDNWMLIEKIINSVSYLEEYDVIKVGGTEPVIEDAIVDDNNQDDTPPSNDGVKRSGLDKYIYVKRDPITNQDTKIIRDLDGSEEKLYDPWNSIEYEVTSNIVIYGTGDFIATANVGVTKAPDFLFAPVTDSNVQVAVDNLKLSPDEKNLLFILSIKDKNTGEMLGRYKDFYSGLNVVNLENKKVFPLYKVKNTEEGFMMVNYNWASDSSAAYLTRYDLRQVDVYPISDNGTSSSQVYAEYKFNSNMPDSSVIALVDMNRAVIRSFDYSNNRLKVSLYKATLNSLDGTIKKVSDLPTQNILSAGDLKLSVNGRYLMVDGSDVLFDLVENTQSTVRYTDTYNNVLKPNAIKFVDENTFVAKYCAPNTNACYAVGTYDVSSHSFLETDEMQGLTIPVLY